MGATCSGGPYPIGWLQDNAFRGVSLLVEGEGKAEEFSLVEPGQNRSADSQSLKMELRNVFC